MKRLAVLALAATVGCASTPQQAPSVVAPSSEAASQPEFVETKLGRAVRVSPQRQLKIVRRVDPFYPEEARKARTTGAVKLDVLIDTDGNVADVTVLQGVPDGLTEAAVTAARQWKFEPVVMEGHAVPVLFQLTIAFR